MYKENVVYTNSRIFSLKKEKFLLYVSNADETAGH